MQRNSDVSSQPVTTSRNSAGHSSRQNSIESETLATVLENATVSNVTFSPKRTSRIIGPRGEERTQPFVNPYTSPTMKLPTNNRLDVRGIMNGLRVVTSVDTVSINPLKFRLTMFA